MTPNSKFARPNPVRGSACGLAAVDEGSYSDVAIVPASYGPASEVADFAIHSSRKWMPNWNSCLPTILVALSSYSPKLLTSQNGLAVPNGYAPVEVGLVRPILVMLGQFAAWKGFGNPR